MFEHLDRLFRPAAIPSGAPYPGHYDVLLVGLSLLVAILASFGALAISARIEAARSTLAHLAWAAAGAGSMGLGIWSMHFIGMLAFSLPCGISYDRRQTLISIIPGILAGGVALELISKRKEVRLGTLVLGALLMGGGIGTMHYWGMAAVRLPGLLRYDARMVALSVLVAAACAFLALSMRCVPFLRTALGRYSMLASAVVMGCAIAGMHYTAMDASVFYPAAPGASLAAVDPKMLALVIAVLDVFVLALVLAATFAGAQFETAQRLKEEMAQRRELEQEALRGRAGLQAVFDSVVDAIITADAEGVIRQWSPAAERIFGYRRDEAVGAPLTLVVPQPAGLTELPRTDVGNERDGRRKDGTTFPVEVSVSRVSGGAPLFTCVIRDISKRQRDEAQLVEARRQADAANKAKSLFLANMSQEIRTPINVIVGMAQLVAGTDLHPRERDYVRKIQESSLHLLGIVNDILDYSKIDAGEAPGRKAEFGRDETSGSVAGLRSDTKAPVRRLLVVDHNANARAAVLDMLTSLGFSADAVVDGRAAIEALREAGAHGRPYDVLFVDWQMPDIDGVATIRRICAAVSPPPACVLLTADGSEEALRLAGGAGLVEVLVKPVTPTVLCDATLRALGEPSRLERGEGPVRSGPGLRGSMA